jgi:hypothetical protein
MKKISLTKKIKQGCLTIDQLQGSNFFLPDAEAAQIQT